MQVLKLKTKATYLILHDNNSGGRALSSALKKNVWSASVRSLVYCATLNYI